MANWLSQEVWRASRCTSNSQKHFGLYDDQWFAVESIISYEKNNIANNYPEIEDYQIDINLQSTCATVHFKTGKGESFIWYTLWKTSIQTK